MLWVPTTLGGAVMTILIPVFLSKKARYSTQKAFSAELQGWMLVMGLMLAAGTYFLVPTLIEQFWRESLSATRLNYIQEFSASFFIPAACTPLIFLYSALLMANKQQWNTLFEAIPSLVILGGIIAFHASTSSIGPMYWGTLIGYIAQAASLYWLLKITNLAPDNFRVTVKSAQWLDMRTLIGPLLLSQFFLSWTTPIDMAAAIKLGAGAVAQLSYAERLLSLIISIGSIAISRAVLPVFSEIAAKEEWEKLLDASLKWGGIMFLLGTLACCIAWPLAPWAVEKLFQRGAFTASDTAAVADVFRLGLTRIPFLFAGVVFFQLLASQRKFGWVAAITLLCILVKYPANAFLAMHFGAGGINLATGLMYFSTALLQLFAGIFLIRKQLS